MEKQQTPETNDHGEVLSIHMEHSPSPQQMMHAESDPIAALMTLVTNTGHGRFADTNRITDNWSAVAQMNESQGIPDYIQNLRKEIEENLTKENTGHVFDNFIQAWDIEAKLTACASCGIKAFEMGSVQFHQIPLHQLDSLLMSDETKEDLMSISAEFRLYLFNANKFTSRTKTATINQ